MKLLTQLIIICAVFCTSSIIQSTNGKNILAFLPLGSKSHKRMFEPLVTALAGRNHQVTIVSASKPSKAQKNVREIITNTSIWDVYADPLKLRAEGVVGLMTKDYSFIIEACHRVYQDPQIVGLMKEPFDLILLDGLGHDCFYGLVSKIGAPYIFMVPQAAPSYITEIVGNFLPSSFVPSALLPFSHEMVFHERMINFLLSCLLWGFGSSLGKKQEAVYKKELGEDMPGYLEIASNVSLIFSNSHFTQTFPRPLLPSVIEVGGMHCRPALPLPKDLEEFVSGAKDGFIFFSLGSIVQGNQLPESTRKVFLNVFSRLKQRILWKWETGEMPDLPANVKVGKWLPQQDLLGHPNIRLFMTHGGLFSTQEAMYHGVPLIGIPIFGDQNLNMNQAELAGNSLTVEILDVTEESLEKTMREILDNKKYAIRAKELSLITRDQTSTPLERGVFWSEYIIRHKGGKHLRSAAMKLNTFQYYCVDVICVLLAVLLAVLWVLKLIVVKLVSICIRKTTKFGEKKANKKTD